MRSIKFSPYAWQYYLEWLEKDRKTFIRITELIREAARNPSKGKGQPELLKHKLSGLWSRRIDLEHRLVYSANDFVQLCVFLCVLCG